MKYTRRKLFGACQLSLLAVGIFFYIPLSGQDLCVQNLEQAQRSFEQGRFYEVESFLVPCIRSGFNRQERIQAIELLALTKMYLDDLEEADSIYLSLLRIDPEHTVNEAIDPPDLIFLHNSFRTDPLFLWSLIAGGNISSPWIIFDDYSAFSNNERNEEYSLKGGFEIGLGLEANIKRNFYVGLEALYSIKRFSYSNQTLVDNSFEFSYMNISQWFNIPAFLKYYFGEGRITYYGYMGPAFDYLLNEDLSNLEQTPINAPQINRQSNVLDRRNNINFSFVIGAGVRYKTNGISLLVLDVKLNPGLTNLVKESQRYSDQSEVFIFGSVDKVYRINSISFTLRFMQPYYRPKKLK